MAHEQPVDRLLDDILLQAVREAAASGAPVRTSIYRRKFAETPLRLNMVVPLVHTGTPARGVFVLRIDPHHALFPMLAAWPMPSTSGETVLWRVTGNRQLALNRPPARALARRLHPVGAGADQLAEQRRQVHPARFCPAAR